MLLIIQSLYNIFDMLTILFLMITLTVVCLIIL